MPSQPPQKQKKKPKGRKRSSSVDIARNPIVAKLSKQINTQSYVKYVAERLNASYRNQEKNKKQPVVHEISSIDTSDGTTAEFPNHTVITRSRKSSSSTQPLEVVMVNQRISMKGRYKNSAPHQHPQPWKAPPLNKNPRNMPIKLVESNETECSSNSVDISQTEERSVRSILRHGLSRNLRTIQTPVFAGTTPGSKSPIPDRLPEKAPVLSPIKVARMSHMPSGSRSPSPAPKKSLEEPRQPVHTPELRSNSIMKGYQSASMQKFSPMKTAVPVLRIRIPEHVMTRDEYEQARIQTRDFTDASPSKPTDLEQEIEKWLELAEMRSAKSGKSGRSARTSKTGKSGKSAKSFNKSARGKATQPKAPKSPKQHKPIVSPAKSPFRPMISAIKDKSPKVTDKKQNVWFQDEGILAHMSDWTSESEENSEPDTYTPTISSRKPKNQIVSYSFRKKIHSPSAGVTTTLGKRSTSKTPVKTKNLEDLPDARRGLRVKFEATSHVGAAVEQANVTAMFECGCGKVYNYEKGLQRHWASKHGGKTPAGCKYPPEHRFNNPQLLRPQKLEAAVVAASSSHRPVRLSIKPQPILPKYADKLYQAVQSAYSGNPNASKEAKMREQLRQMSANLPFLYSMTSLEDNYVHFEGGFGAFIQSFEVYRHKFRVTSTEDPATLPFPETLDEKMLVSSSLAQMFLGPIQDWGQVSFALLDLEKRFVFLGETSITRKLYYTNANTPLSITYVMAAYLISIKHLVSIRYYSEVAACMTMLRSYINEHYADLLSSQLDDGDFTPGPDVCESNYPETLPLFVPGFLKDGFAKYVLDSSKFRTASNLKILGLAPPQYTQLVHSMRLFCLWMLELGFTKTSLSLAASHTASGQQPSTKLDTMTPRKTPSGTNPNNFQEVEDSNDLSVPPISQMSFGQGAQPQSRIKAE